MQIKPRQVKVRHFITRYHNRIMCKNHGESSLCAVRFASILLPEKGSEGHWRHPGVRPRFQDESNFGSVMKETPIVCVGIGELLWDVLPEGKQLGGAPANFACHAGQLGAHAVLVSCVGKDMLGVEILEQVTRLGLQQKYIQVCGEHPTGTVDVKIDEGGHPKYVIHERVAWDCLAWTPPLQELARRTDAVCFGTLAQRNAASRHAIHTFLQTVPSECLRILDVNLRQSYYTPDIIDESLRAANVLKLNEEELAAVCRMLALETDAPVDRQLAMLRERYKLKLIALTAGGRGSSMVTEHETVCCDTPAVKVRDTVGAGDAFAAAVAIGRLRGLGLHDINCAASRVASYVCSQAGATPTLPDDLVRQFSLRNEEK